MASKHKNEFESFISDIVLNKEFNRLNKERHHGITRYEHSMRVAKYTYKVCRKIKSSRIREATRAALLHDFFENEELKGNKSFRMLNLHPNVALKNSKKYYKLDKVQEDIIVKHMFPLTLSLPKYKETWIVSLVDKIVSSYEMIRFKLPLYTSMYLLFLIQFLTLPR